MTTTDIEALEQHLLYHKALAESPEEIERINGYLSTLNSAVDGTKLADPVDEAIRRMFVMVLEDGFDPWAIDLEFFVETYSKKIAEDKSFDVKVLPSYRPDKALGIEKPDYLDYLKKLGEIGSFAQLAQVLKERRLGARLVIEGSGLVEYRKIARLADPGNSAIWFPKSTAYTM